MLSPLQERYVLHTNFIGTPEKLSKNTKKIIPLDYVIIIVQKKIYSTANEINV